MDIRKKSVIINTIIPIFDKYPMLTNKIYDFLRIKNYVMNNVTSFKHIGKYTRPGIPFYTVETILCKPYFCCLVNRVYRSRGAFWFH